MTLDEAIKHCEEVANDKADLACTLWDSKEKARCEECANEHKQLAEWLRELKAYKDQDGDTIYRQAAIHVASGYCHPANIANELSKLPPTQPKPKTAHWIEIAQYSDGKHKIECSECGNHIFDRGHANSFNVRNKYKYCPNCGARMIKPQESEE